jgi:iron complex outermembrane receptor protein
MLGNAQGVERVTLRGVDTENVQGGSIGGDPGVACGLNGITIAHPQGIPAELYDLDRVEVLRGPQSTLDGRNATGGAVNVIACGPTSDFDGYLEGLTGHLSRLKIKVAIGGLLADGFRVAGFIECRGGFIDNIVPTGTQNIGNLRHQGVRGSLDFQLGEKITAKMFVDCVIACTTISSRQLAPA